MEKDRYPTLNLPAFNIRTKEEDGNLLVWDQVRKKWIILLPEEWVRQHFVNLLISHLNYPAGLIRLESQLKYNKKIKRSDIQVLDRAGGVYLLVECKSFNVPISKSTLQQIAIYNKSINARYIAVTNGMNHFIWELDNKKGQYTALSSFPNYAVDQR